MTPETIALIGIDLAAAAALTFGLYYPRHRRRDLIVAFFGVNVGVLAVTMVLGTAEIAVGLGLGLFGVLSIIRLRSSEISQREVAYYFASLAIGLIAGLTHSNIVIPATLIVLILVVMWIADHPSLLSRSRHEIVRLDRAIANEHELRSELEARVGGTVTGLTVQQLDYVNDSTLVDVRFKVDRTSDIHEGGSEPKRVNNETQADERADAERPRSATKQTQPTYAMKGATS